MSSTRWPNPIKWTKTLRRDHFLALRKVSMISLGMVAVVLSVSTKDWVGHIARISRRASVVATSLRTLNRYMCKSMQSWTFHTQT